MRRRQTCAAGAAFIVLVLALLPSGGFGQSRVVVTVNELTAANHRLVVTMGSEVVWADPHFDRVWFPSTARVVVRRTAEGWSAVFERPGRYDGRFTLVSTHGGVGDVYPLTVVVTEK
jgi:hypothetical protein